MTEEKNIACTVDRIEAGQAVLVSDSDGSVCTLSEKQSAGLREGDKVMLSLPEKTIKKVAAKQSNNGERLRRLFDKNKK